MFVMLARGHNESVCILVYGGKQKNPHSSEVVVGAEREEPSRNDA